MPIRKPILAGEKFFRLTVISNAPSRKGSSGFPIYSVTVRCDCGNELIVPEYKLRAKHTKSCGCLQVEKARQNLPPSTHGQSASSRTTEYVIWSGIKQRCNPKNKEIFKNYAGKNIKVCERWNKFENFFSDMGKRPGDEYSVERLDNNKDYMPSNCYWADWETQARNRSNNRNVTIDNEVMCISQAVRILNTHESKIVRMVKKLGITHQEAVNLLLLKPRPVNMKQFKEALKRKHEC